MLEAGKMFKKIRESKKLTQKEVADGICSPKQVSAFEQGDSNISFDKLFKLLHKLNITLQEFEFLLQGYKFDETTEMLAQAQVYYNQSKKTALKILTKQIKERISSKNDELNYIKIKTLLSFLDDKVKITDREKETICDYLMSVELWGYYELNLYATTMRLFNTEAIYTLSKEIVNKGAFYHSIPRNKKIYTSIIVNTMMAFITRADYQYALEFKTIIESQIDQDDFFHRTILLFVTGVLDFGFENFDSGKAKIEDALEIMSKINSTDFLEIYQNNYEIVLKQAEL